MSPYNKDYVLRSILGSQFFGKRPICKMQEAPCNLYLGSQSMYNHMDKSDLI